MNQYIERLNAYLAEHKPEYGCPDVDSQADLLYYTFCIEHSLDTEQIKHKLLELSQILAKLSVGDDDRIFDLTCDLCEGYQREAFREGVLIGARRYRELEGKA